MTHCKPALAVGLNRFNAPACARAVAVRRQDAAISRWLDSITGRSN